MNSEPVCNGRGQVVGRIFTDGDTAIFQKRNLNSDRHMLHTPLSWATDKAHLDQLAAYADARGLAHARVELETTKGHVYEADLVTFDTHGVTINRQFGVQVALPIEKWTHHAPGTRQLSFV